ncbi:hypothetical protein ACVXG7_28525 [Enterobacter hormaechei]
MGIWYQRWADARPSRRVLCWLIASGLVAWAIWGLLLRPAALRYADVQAQAISAKRINASLWPEAGRQAVFTQVTPSRPFSPLHFSVRTQDWCTGSRSRVGRAGAGCLMGRGSGALFPAGA